MNVLNQELIFVERRRIKGSKFNDYEDVYKTSGTCPHCYAYLVKLQNPDYCPMCGFELSWDHDISEPVETNDPVIKALENLEHNIKDGARYAKTDETFMAIVIIGDAIADTIKELRGELNA